MDICPNCGTRDAKREYINGTDDTEYWCLGDDLVGVDGNVPVFYTCNLRRTDEQAVRWLEEEERKQEEREELERAAQADAEQRDRRKRLVAEQGAGSIPFCEHGEVATRRCVTCGEFLCEESHCSHSIDRMWYCHEHAAEAKARFEEIEAEAEARRGKAAAEAKKREENAERERYLALPVPNHNQLVDALRSSKGEPFYFFARTIRPEVTWRAIAAAVAQLHGREEFFWSDNGTSKLLATDGTLYLRVNDSERGASLERPESVVQSLHSRIPAIAQGRSRTAYERATRDAGKREAYQAKQKEQARFDRERQARKTGESELAKSLWPLLLLFPLLFFGAGLYVSHLGEIGTLLLSSVGRGLLYGLVIFLKYTLPVVAAFCVTLGGLGFANAMIDRGGRVPVALFFLGIPFVCGILYGG